ncbi:hypothetical protein BCR32DRAFT_280171 [Anaeromyces robustus]|uniref:DNA-directed RNA polymerase n=1 Tax=Anaeromyces robustus TaxID=1754192 RepID=A0A1Y1X592_9FUNG|nr:hypothetical protein BCR32DRAFT_280171 [Anaeromyces robustus]|eukprot:ORX80872.1 hypothetical protein BCR32DRAFT_280171 [Anaeromyces robustus]
MNYTLDWNKKNKYFDINTLTKKCYEEVPSFSAWNLDICYATEEINLDANALVKERKNKYTSNSINTFNRNLLDISTGNGGDIHKWKIKVFEFLFTENIDSSSIIYKECITPEIGSLRYAHSECDNIINISIESNDIPNELIHHFNTSTSYVKYKPQNFTIQNSGIQCDIDAPEFCKDNVCVCMKESMIKPFIELPDQNGHIHKYILVPYSSYFESFIYEYNNNETIYVSLECKNDAQCFSNKCFNNTCTYNKNSDVIRCDRIYTKSNFFSRNKDTDGHIHCGRMLNEYCTDDIECSFNNCSNNRCSSIHYIPSEFDSVVIDYQDIFGEMGHILIKEFMNFTIFSFVFANIIYIPPMKIYNKELEKGSILIENKYELIDNTTSYTLEPQLPCKQLSQINLNLNLNQNQNLKSKHSKKLFIHSKSGRFGIISTSLNISSSGYLQRELVKSMEDLVTNEQESILNYNNEKIYYYLFSTPDIDNIFLEHAFSMSNI